MSWFSLVPLPWNYWHGSRDSEEESSSATNLTRCDFALEEERTNLTFQWGRQCTARDQHTLDQNLAFELCLSAVAYPVWHREL